MSFFSKLDWVSYIVSIAKTASKKIGALFHSMKFISSLFLISIYLTYSLAWTAVVMTGLLLLAAAEICWINDRN